MAIHFISNKDIGDAVSAAIDKAKSEICLTSPWVIGNRLQSLFSKDAKIRIRNGEVSLKIVIRLRDLSDMEITDAATLSFLREIGADLHFSSQLHAKLIIIDSKLAFASSSNITGSRTDHWRICLRNTSTPVPVWSVSWRLYRVKTPTMILTCSPRSSNILKNLPESLQPRGMELPTGSWPIMSEC